MCSFLGLRLPKQELEEYHIRPNLFEEHRLLQVCWMVYESSFEMENRDLDLQDHQIHSLSLIVDFSFLDRVVSPHSTSRNDPSSRNTRRSNRNREKDDKPKYDSLATLPGLAKPFSSQYFLYLVSKI